MGISSCIIIGRAVSCPDPPSPGEPVPSVPPVAKADWVPLRYGSFRTAYGSSHENNMSTDAIVDLVWFDYNLLLI
jgi:hypothetical protein